jgi:hypothetical protein
MKGADFVLLVTEPTPFGLHDLKLAVGAVRILGIPCGLVINRSDMGDDRLREYAGAEGIPILMEIPFDRKIAESYSRGELLIDARPEWRERFVRLFDRIAEIVKTLANWSSSARAGLENQHCGRLRFSCRKQSLSCGVDRRIFTIMNPQATERHDFRPPRPSSTSTNTACGQCELVQVQRDHRGP